MRKPPLRFRFLPKPLFPLPDPPAFSDFIKFHFHNDFELWFGVGVRYRVTKQSVNQCKNRGLEKLKKNLHLKLLTKPPL